jgi:hypothetical protein|tara:strand:- start:299 stop:442 length:144 start_codon:yes stop_codon:yes gene_type:complete
MAMRRCCAQRGALGGNENKYHAHAVIDTLLRNIGFVCNEWLGTNLAA